jgi:transcriptional regulator with XRE-family HTH domain
MTQPIHMPALDPQPRLERASRATPNFDGSLLKRLRLSRGWTQQEVADDLYARCVEYGKPEAGINADTVGRWERGQSIPCARYRVHLCTMFNVSEAQLGLLPAKPLSNQMHEAQTTPTLVPVPPILATPQLRRFVSLLQSLQEPVVTRPFSPLQ